MIKAALLRPHKYVKRNDYSGVCATCGWSRLYRIHQPWWWRATHRVSHR